MIFRTDASVGDLSAHFGARRACSASHYRQLINADIGESGW